MVAKNVARLVVCMALALVLHVSGNIMGIDFGSDTMKVSLVQSGKALQIGKYSCYYYCAVDILCRFTRVTHLNSFHFI